MRALLSIFVLLLAAFGLQADPIPGHFTVNLNNPAGSDSGSGGWNAGQFFSAQANSGASQENFFDSPFFPDVCPYEFCDPDIIIDDAGLSSAIQGLTFNFTANDNGGGIFSFVNKSGIAFTDLLITTNFDPTTPPPYICGGNIYENCGFLVDGDTLSILFSGGAIPTVPEPGMWILMPTAVAMLGSRRLLRRLSRRS